MEKLSLLDFQRWLQQMLLDPGGMAPRKNGQEPLRPEEVINASQKLAPWQHLALYQRGYTARLRECLAKQFVALEYALGGELFRAFADEYLCRYPSESYNLANLGNRFAQYLEETRPDRDAQVREVWPDFMIELARFENAINHLFDARLPAEEQLFSMEYSGEQLSVAPGLLLLAGNFPVYAYYRSVIKGQAPDLPEMKATHYAIVREDFRLRFTELPMEQFLFLQSWCGPGGQNNDQSATLTSKQLPENWLAWRKAWLRAGLIRTSL